MNYLRFSFPVLLLFSLIGCAPKMSINHATLQNWMGGAAGSGGGTNYEVKLEKSAKQIIKIEKVWLGNRDEGIWPRFAVKQTASGPRLTNPIAEAGWTEYFIIFSKVNPNRPNPHQDLDEGPNVPKPEPAPSDLPKDFVSGAVIYYTFGTDIVNQISVNEFTALDPLAYP